MLNFKKTCKILSWNINGIKTKFSSPYVQELFKEYDIVVINETHLNILDKCPKIFIFVSRSKPIKSKYPRGGVAIFRNMNSDIDTECITTDFRDCVIFKVMALNVTCIVPYIPPSNSKYTSPIYMDSLKLFLDTFKNVPTIIFGDLNSRYGQPPVFSDKINYQINPDTIINQNGRSLLDMLQNERNFLIVNGLQYNEMKCDSDFTFYRGTNKSQNDICITNHVDILQSFSILDKNTYSDHRPICIEICSKPVIPLDTINACAKHTFSHDHYDINRKLIKPIKLRNLNIPNTIRALEETAQELTERQ